MARAPRKAPTGRLAAVTLDEASLGSSSDDIEHERRVAIYDLIEENSFKPVEHDGGPYALHLGLRGGRLCFAIQGKAGNTMSRRSHQPSGGLVANRGHDLRHFGAK